MLPPIPRFVASAMGPVPVFVHEKLKTKKTGKHYFGKYNYFTREIHLSLEPSHVMQIQTLEHEKIHMALYDAGLHNVLTEGQQELICDVIASARVAEMLARLR